MMREGTLSPETVEEAKSPPLKPWPTVDPEELCREPNFEEKAKFLKGFQLQFLSRDKKKGKLWMLGVTVLCCDKVDSLGQPFKLCRSQDLYISGCHIQGKGYQKCFSIILMSLYCDLFTLHRARANQCILT